MRLRVPRRLLVLNTEKTIMVTCAVLNVVLGGNFRLPTLFFFPCLQGCTIIVLGCSNERSAKLDHRDPLVSLACTLHSSHAFCLVRQLDIALHSSELSIIPSSSFFFPLGLKMHIRERKKILLNTMGQQNHFSAILTDKTIKVFWAVFFSILLQSCAYQHTQKEYAFHLQRAQSFHFYWSLHASLRSPRAHRSVGSSPCFYSPSVPGAISWKTRSCRVRREGWGHQGI